MRSTVEFIRELDLEAEEFAGSTKARTAVGIAVRSEKDGGIVWSYDEDLQAVLDSLVRGGGEPIGLIRISDSGETGGKIAVDSILFEEFTADPSARPALKNICRLFGDGLLERLKRAGAGPKVTYFEDPSGLAPVI